MSTYKEKIPFNKRLEESKRVMEKYPGRIPIIVENKGVPEFDKNKYLVPSELTMGQLIYVIRKRIHLDSEKALFIMLENGTLPPTSALISTLYKDHVSDDGFLTFYITGENTFGCYMRF